MKERVGVWAGREGGRLRQAPLPPAGGEGVALRACLRARAKVLCMPACRRPHTPPCVCRWHMSNVCYDPEPVMRTSLPYLYNKHDQLLT